LNKKAIIKEYALKHRYFSLSQIVRDLKLKRKTAIDYLFQLKNEETIFDAGYGFYSSISKRFILPTISREQDIAQFLKREFPALTDFVVWDTKSLQSFYHHTQTHHITFVEVDKEAILSVYESLYVKFRNVLKESHSKVFYKSFDVRLDPVVVRNLVSRSPISGHIPALEKILIDMFMDLDKYAYISKFDYREIWRNLLKDYRMDIRIIKSYSKRRKCSEALFSQLIDIMGTYDVDFCQLLRDGGKNL